MTAAEKALIEQLDRFVRGWQRQDAEWKDGMDDWRRSVEEYITTQKTADQIASDRKQSTRLNRAQIITAFGIAGSFVLGLVNHFS